MTARPEDYNASRFKPKRKYTRRVPLPIPEGYEGHEDYLSISVPPSPEQLVKKLPERLIIQVSRPSRAPYSPREPWNTLIKLGLAEGPPYRLVDKAIRDTILDADQKQRILDCDIPGIVLLPDGLSASMSIKVIQHNGLRVDTFIDRSDIARVHNWKVTARKRGEYFSVHVTSGGSTQSFPRLLLDVTDPDLIVVHRDRDALNNRRENLKTVRVSSLGNRTFPPRLSNPRGTFSTESSLLYYGADWPEMRAAAMTRANGICERCRKKPPAQVHHKLPVRFFANPNDANFLENLLAVCMRCHRKEHEWIKKNLPLLHFALLGRRIRNFTIDSA